MYRVDLEKSDTDGVEELSASDIPDLGGGRRQWV